MPSGTGLRGLTGGPGGVGGPTRERKGRTLDGDMVAWQGQVERAWREAAAAPIYRGCSRSAMPRAARRSPARWRLLDDDTGFILTPARPDRERLPASSRAAT